MTNIPKQDRVISTFFKWTNPSPWSIWSKNVVKVYYWSKIFLSKLRPIYYILYIIYQNYNFEPRDSKPRENHEIHHVVLLAKSAITVTISKIK